MPRRSWKKSSLRRRSLPNRIVLQRNSVFAALICEIKHNNICFPARAGNPIPNQDNRQKNLLWKKELHRGFFIVPQSKSACVSASSNRKIKKYRNPGKTAVAMLLCFRRSSGKPEEAGGAFANGRNAGSLCAAPLCARALACEALRLTESLQTYFHEDTRMRCSCAVWGREGIFKPRSAPHSEDALRRESETCRDRFPRKGMVSRTEHGKERYAQWFVSARPRCACAGWVTRLLRYGQGQFRSRGWFGTDNGSSSHAVASVQTTAVPVIGLLGYRQGQYQSYGRSGTDSGSSGHEVIRLQTKVPSYTVVPIQITVAPVMRFFRYGQGQFRSRGRFGTDNGSSGHRVTRVQTRAVPVIRSLGHGQRLFRS